MGSPAADPFALTPDTRAYVPRAASERALAALAAAVQQREPALLVGAAGAGKTLLLHLLGERAGPGLRPVYLPNPRLEPRELCTWVTAGFGAPPEDDPQLLLRAWIAHLRSLEEGCLLLVDDADAMPEATVRWLASAAAQSQGGLRLALASLAGAPADRVVRALGAGVRVVLFDAPLGRDETAEYVAWRLRHANAPDALRARFDAAALAELHRVAAGNPRRIHLAALAIERGRPITVAEDHFEAPGDGEATPAVPGLAVARPAPSPGPQRPAPRAAPDAPVAASGRIALAAAAAFLAAALALAWVFHG